MEGNIVRGLLQLGPIRRCELNLVSFFHRHPNVYLPPDQLAACVGYEYPEVERGIQTLISAGLIVRRNGQKPGLVMYRLTALPPANWLPGRARIVSTEAGTRRPGDVVRHRPVAWQAAWARQRATGLMSRAKTAAELNVTLLNELLRQTEEARRLIAEAARLVGRATDEGADVER
jgi:hypothetical protein